MEKNKFSMKQYAEGTMETVVKVGYPDLRLVYTSAGLRCA